MFYFIFSHSINTNPSKIPPYMNTGMNIGTTHVSQISTFMSHCALRKAADNLLI
jgi:hypothetical protein